MSKIKTVLIALLIVALGALAGFAVILLLVALGVL